MGIRIGSKSLGGDRTIPPTTKGWALYAQRRLDNTVARQNSRHSEALKVDGAFLYVWIRSYTGYPCTCVSRSNPRNLTPASTSPFLQDPTQLGQTSQKTTERLRGDLADEEDGPYTLRVSRPGSVNLAVTQDPVFGPIVNPPSDTSGVDDESILSEEDSGDPFNAADLDLTPEQIASLANDIGAGAVSGFDKTSCGICQGTGYVDGYRLHNGQRIVLDASGQVPVTTILGFSVNRSAFPAAFVGPRDGQAYVSWVIQLPTYFKAVLGLKVHNNYKDVAQNAYVLEYRLTQLGTSAPWSLLTPAALTSYNGIATTLELRVRTLDSGNSGDRFAFTHVDLYYAFADMPYGQSPQISKTTNYEVWDTIIETTWEISGMVPYVDKECLVQESKFGKFWRVVSAVNRITNLRQNIGCELTTRVEQRKYSKAYSLSLMPDAILQFPFTSLDGPGANQGQLPVPFMPPQPFSPTEPTNGNPGNSA